MIVNTNIASRKFYIFISLYAYIGENVIQSEVFTLVKIPISEIENLVRSRYNLPNMLTDIQIEADALVLYFREKPAEKNPRTLTKEHQIIVKKKRRTRRKRNRMKTRGWKVVARIRNSKGQKCAVYEPFVEALKDPLPPADQRLVVAKILRSNKNRPSETSIQYFLENTLEYLEKQQQKSAREYNK